MNIIGRVTRNAEVPNAADDKQDKYRKDNLFRLCLSKNQGIMTPPLNNQSILIII